MRHKTYKAVLLGWQLLVHFKVAQFIISFDSGQHWILPLQMSCCLARWSEFPGTVTHSLVCVRSQGPKGLGLVVQHEQGISNDAHVEALTHQLRLHQFERACDLQRVLQGQWL